ncbi:unnamed protein product [Alopecurus aequalis]
MSVVAIVVDAAQEEQGPEMAIGAVTVVSSCHATLPTPATPLSADLAVPIAVPASRCQRLHSNPGGIVVWWWSATKIKVACMQQQQLRYIDMINENESLSVLVGSTPQGMLVICGLLTLCVSTTMWFTRGQFRFHLLC